MHYPTVRLFTVNNCASLASAFSKRTPSAIVHVRSILGTQVSKRDSAIVRTRSILGTQVSKRVCVIVRTILGAQVFAHCSYAHKTGTHHMRKQ